MKKIYLSIMVVAAVALIWIVASHAQNVPSSAISAGVGLAKSAVDDQRNQISILNSAIASEQQDISNQQAKIAEQQQEIVLLQSNIVQIQTNLTSMAKANPPIQDAVDLLNSNPAYGTNWTTLITNVSGVNWSYVGQLNAQGLNWSDIQNTYTGVNWDDINLQEADLNWVDLQNAGINWNS
jgi:uncharacterized protein YjbI with pentapeptide repeats